jgi:predicted ABC-type ATPase
MSAGVGSNVMPDIAALSFFKEETSKIRALQGARPLFIISAGSQGAGKSKTARIIRTPTGALSSFLNGNITRENTVNIDVDRYVTKYQQTAPATEYMEARSVFGDVLSDALVATANVNRSNIIWETNLRSTAYTLSTIETMRLSGYAIIVILTVGGTAMTLNDRLAKRKGAGGNGQEYYRLTDEALIEISQNVSELRHHTDRIILFDNSGVDAIVGGAIATYYTGERDKGVSGDGWVVMDLLPTGMAMGRDHPTRKFISPKLSAIFPSYPLTPPALPTKCYRAECENAAQYVFHDPTPVCHLLECQQSLGR